MSFIKYLVWMVLFSILLSGKPPIILLDAFQITVSTFFQACYAALVMIISCVSQAAGYIENMRMIVEKPRWDENLILILIEPLQSALMTTLNAMRSAFPLSTSFTAHIDFIASYDYFLSACTRLAALHPHIFCVFRDSLNSLLYDPSTAIISVVIVLTVAFAELWAIYYIALTVLRAI
jgi:hypothetical protein